MAGIDLLNLDLSVVYQLALFLLALLVLSRWLIKPVTLTLAERQRRLFQAEGELPMETELLQKEKEYRDVLQRTRSQSSRLRQGIREEAIRSERKMLADAQERAVQKLKAAREEIQDTMEHVQAEIDGETPRLARNLARKILGRELTE